MRLGSPSRGGGVLRYDLALLVDGAMSPAASVAVGVTAEPSAHLNRSRHAGRQWGHGLPRDSQRFRIGSYYGA